MLYLPLSIRLSFHFLLDLIFSSCPCFHSFFLHGFFFGFIFVPSHCFPSFSLPDFFTSFPFAAWSLCRAALAPLCFACVGVVVLVVVSDDVFSLAPLSVCIVLFSSWGMPGLCFSRENLHLPWKLVGPPIWRVAHLDGCPCSTTIPHSWHRVATASPPSLTLLPLRRAVVASAEGAESSASSSVCSPSEGTPNPRW